MTKEVNINELKSLLAKGPMTFTFNKKDGSQRTMSATTNNSWFDESLYQVSPNKVLTVWDLEKEEFRNVHVDAIASF